MSSFWFRNVTWERGRKGPIECGAHGLRKVGEYEIREDDPGGCYKYACSTR